VKHAFFVSASSTHQGVQVSCIAKRPQSKQDKLLVALLQTPQYCCAACCWAVLKQGIRQEKSAKMLGLC
jgi:hypothetical protein